MLGLTSKTMSSWEPFPRFVTSLLSHTHTHTHTHTHPHTPTPPQNTHTQPHTTTHTHQHPHTHTHSWCDQLGPLRHGHIQHMPDNTSSPLPSPAHSAEQARL